MKFRSRLWILCSLPLVWQGTARAQAAVEYSLGLGRAATSTAPAANLGKSIGGVLSGADKALKSAGAEAGSASASSAPAASKNAAPAQAASLKTTGDETPDKAAAAPTEKPVYESPDLIKAGMAYDELTRRFGPPSMELTSEQGRKTLEYSGKNGVIRLEVRAGKVALVNSPKPNESAVVLLQ